MFRMLIEGLARRLPLLTVLMTLSALNTVQAEPLESVRKAFAAQVYAQHRADIHEDRPQALLRAIVVLRIRIDDNFQWTAEVLREKDNQPEMTAKALRTVKSVPVPENLTDEEAFELTHIGFIESWLFESNGRFALKTVAKPQHGN